MREFFWAASIAVLVVLGIFALPRPTYSPNPASFSFPGPSQSASPVVAPPAGQAAAGGASAPAGGATSPSPAGDHAAAGQPGHEPAAAPVAAAPQGGQAVAEGDVAHGRVVYRKCQACHSLDPGRNLVGPSLAGVIGRKAGAETGYAYSPAMKASGLTWDVATLDRYLLDPPRTVPGNKMPFPGLKTENERKDVIAFLVAQAAGGAAASPAASAPAAGAAAGAPSQPAPASYVPDIRYTLRSGIAEGRMVYIGVGGDIDGKINPDLRAARGQGVQITLINGEGAEHDIFFPEQAARSPRVTGRGSSTVLSFRPEAAGEYAYVCSVPGHQQAGMQGKFIVTPDVPQSNVAQAVLSREANDVPPPVGARAPRTVQVELETVELEGRLAEGTTFGFWTFNGKVPGPFLRVRVGDTVEVKLKNAPGSAMVHSVDFHAATGPGGGAAATQTNPGDEKTVKFKALTPGLFVYHCATPMVAQHIANGMYGLILVEPEGGLPPVDREFYVMQGEVYTEAAFGQHGSQDFSVEKLLAERPEYFVFNGSVGALSSLHPMKAKVGETVRIFFGVGGPNYTSSFHVIGEIFDKVYNLADVQSPPARGVQTVTVPAGGATIVEFKLDVPGNYVLVDHALSRMERGLVGILQAEGEPNNEIFEGHVEAGGGH
jgi:nitrite reductase (NO-forming)